MSKDYQKKTARTSTTTESPLRLPALRDALEAEVRKTVGPAVHDEGINAA